MELGHFWRVKMDFPSRRRKIQTCFMGERTSQIGSVCWDFFFLGKKSPYTKILKKFHEFLQIFLENILSYFQTFSAKINRFWPKKKIKQRKKFLTLLTVRSMQMKKIKLRVCAMSQIYIYSKETGPWNQKKREVQFITMQTTNAMLWVQMW